MAAELQTTGAGAAPARGIADLRAGLADLRPAAGGGPLGGLGIVWGREWAAWFGTRRWLQHLVIWLSLLVVLPVAMLAAAAGGQAQGEGGAGNLGISFSFPPEAALALYTGLGGIAVGLGAIVATMSAVVDEKVRGTILFLLSKPVSRTAFVLGKFGANGAALLLLAVVAPGALLYVLSGLMGGGAASLAGWLGGHLLLALHLLVLVALTVLLGVLFNSVAPVVGIALAALFGSVFMATEQLAALRPYFIWDLPDIASRLFRGAAPTEQDAFTVALSAAWLVVFLLAAALAFARRDL